MIDALVGYVRDILLGSAFYFPIRYIVLRFLNMYAVNFPQWYTLRHVSFMAAIINWGYLIIILAATFNLWTNTQRPEAQY